MLPDLLFPSLCFSPPHSQAINLAYCFRILIYGITFAALPFCDYFYCNFVQNSGEIEQDPLAKLT